MRMLLLVAALALAGAPTGEPALFAEGIITTPDFELNAAFTPDGKSVYFTKSTANLRFWTIVVSHLRDGRWTEPEVATFSGQYSDADPFISPDGSRLFYISRRPPREPDIFYVDRTPAGWSEPKNLGAPVNTDAGEYYPSVAADGTLYFATIRPDSKGRNDLYRSRLVDGRYTEPENLGEPVNSRFNEGDTVVAPDQSFLILTITGRPDDLGQGDLYICRRKDGAWTEPRHLGARINSPAIEFCPILSPDGKTLFFSSTRGFGMQPLTRAQTTKELLVNLRGVHNGLGNIYHVPMAGVLE
jgi:hypothetical protein